MNMVTPHFEDKKYQQACCEMCFQHDHNTGCFQSCWRKRTEKNEYLLQSHRHTTGKKSILTFVHIPSVLVTRVSLQVHNDSGFIYILRKNSNWQYLAVKVEPKMSDRFVEDIVMSWENVIKMLSWTHALKEPHERHVTNLENCQLKNTKSNPGIVIIHKILYSE